MLLYYLQLKNHDGKPLEEIRREAGFVDSLDQVRLPPGYYAAFVEAGTGSAIFPTSTPRQRISPAAALFWSKLLPI